MELGSKVFMNLSNAGLYSFLRAEHTESIPREKNSENIWAIGNDILQK